MEDELADVRLDGVPLVGDDPSEWKVSKRIGRFDDPMQWLEHQHEVETALTPHAPSDSIVDALLGAAESFQIMQYETDPVPYRHHEMAKHLKEMVADCGMSLEMAGAFLGCDPLELVRYLAPSARREDDEARLLAEKMMRQEVPSAEIMAVTGLDDQQLRSWATSLGLQDERVKSAGGGRVAQPKWVRTTALALVTSGLSARQTAERINEGARKPPAPVTAAAVSQWVCRDKKKVSA